MPIVFISETEYSPLELEPYATFNKKFTDRQQNLDGAEIKVGISNRRKGFTKGIASDKFYSDNIKLKFKFSSLIVNGSPDTERLLVIRHVVDYDFKSSFYEFEQQMAEEMVERAPYIYIPGVRQLEMSYKIKDKNMKLIMDVVIPETLGRVVCNQLISCDIAFFARGW